HLRPRGVAVVAVSPRTCFQLSGQDIRAALVRSGVLRDVIALPKGMSAAPGINTHLWVLQRPAAKPDYAPVRMADLSGLGDAADVPHDYAAWQRLFQDADPTIVRNVPRLELLDGDVNLLPRRHVTANIQASADELTQTAERLRTLYVQAADAVPTFMPPPTQQQQHHSFVTLAELERAGALIIRSRDSTPLRGDVI